MVYERTRAWVETPNRAGLCNEFLTWSFPASFEGYTVDALIPVEKSSTYRHKKANCYDRTWLETIDQG